MGGVVVARYGSNPLEVINNVKAKIKEMEPGLPQKVLADGTVSKVTVVPFYDRTGLIKETIGTLETALSHEILICVIVIIVLVLNLSGARHVHHHALYGDSGEYRGFIGYSDRHWRDGGCRGRLRGKYHPLPGDAREQTYTGGKGVCQPYL